MCLITLQGFPAAIQSAGMDFVTTLPLPIIVRSPMETPYNIIHRVPIKTLYPITIPLLIHFSRSSEVIRIR